MTNERRETGDADVRAISAGNRWTRFWFTPIPPTGMQCLRFLSGLLFLFWLLSFVGHQKEFFSQAGWLDKEGILEIQKLRDPAPPSIGWSVLYLAGDNVGAFQAMYWGSIALLAAFTLGLATRLTGILTWVIVVSFLANPAVNYEGDYLLGILAFYLMIGHLLQGLWSGDLPIADRILGPRTNFVFAGWLWPASATDRPSYAANFMMRLLQIHFVIIILTSAVHKLQIADWWAGVALWYPLHPTFKTTLESIRAEAPSAESTLFFLSLAAYLVLAWQLAFPMFAWRSSRWCRAILVGGAAIGWLGTVFVYQLPSFGPFVMLACLSFLRPEEWSAVLSRLRSLSGSAAASQTKIEMKKVPVK